jgi:Uma2 family endonuclease
MVAARAHFPKLTPAEYLEWEEQQELRYEYIDGEISAMTGGGTIDRHEAASSMVRFYADDRFSFPVVEL